MSQKVKIFKFFYFSNSKVPNLFEKLVDNVYPADLLFLCI